MHRARNALTAGLGVVATTAALGACGGEGRTSDATTETSQSAKPEDRLPVLRGDWDRVNVDGAGFPLRLGDELITIAGGGYDNDRMLGYGFDLAAERSRRLPRVPLPWRAGYSVVGSAHEVIVWGGSGGLSGPEGARYRQDSDAWTVISPSPLRIRFGHTAVWDGEEMLVWGGASGGTCGGPLERTGAAYEPELDTWRPLATTPITGRIWHTAVWTGDRMLVWGGASEWDRDCEPARMRADGAAYVPSSDRWHRIPPAPIATTRDADAVWTGKEMLVWNGRAGAGYRPRDNTWRSIAQPPKALRWESGPSRVVVWSGSELIIWGKARKHAGSRTGNDVVAAYDPRADRWAMLMPAPPRVGEPYIGVWAAGSMFALAPDCCHGRKLRMSARFTPRRPSDR